MLGQLIQLHFVVFVVPDEKTLESMLSFLERMQEEVQDDQEQEIEMSIA